ncbi:MAG: Beta-lactamase [uncultured Chloroflexi bacterium]|uniref:Beta-lactamase n=1 Tax=uncultured Chloroflexota bacterium TaxID=166587 RepID=A0A6J4HPP7_9CHLR|nr:MAG: Beta-lactamase [uncultured Chloroflexota bacterium]
MPTTASDSWLPALRRRLHRLCPPCAGTFSYYVKDLRSGMALGIREDDAFPAASVIKVPVLLAALDLVRCGGVSLDDRLRLTAQHKTGGSGIFQHFAEGSEITLGDACTAMIALSDNTATNMVLDVTTVPGVNALLDSLGCARTRLHRYIGKPEMPGPAGPSQAVPTEIGTLLELLARREILTPALCGWALVALRRQTVRSMAPRLLPEGTRMAHKTGSLDGVRHDVGLLWLPNREPADAVAIADGGEEEEDELPNGEPAVFVAMSRGVRDLRWTVENRAEVTIGRAARAVYDALALV